MIFIDSWVWIEFFAESEKSEKAEEVIEKIEERKALITPTVLMEVKYRIEEKFSDTHAQKVIFVIQSFENLEVIPVNTEVGLHAADIRQKYYQRNDCELSYADAIHVAVASMTGCEKLYSGDPDFEGISEVETEVIG